MAKRGPRPAPPTTRASADDSPRLALTDAAITVVGERGFAHASARAIAERAGVAPGVIYYHFGSMDELLVAAHDRLSARRLQRIDAAFRAVERERWIEALASIIRDEIAHPDGASNVELVVGSRTSPHLAEAVARNTDASVELLATYVHALIGEGPAATVIPVDVVAELAAAAFFGLEVMSQAGRDVHIDQLAAPITAVLAALSYSTS